jgi:hypothetical protein
MTVHVISVGVNLLDAFTSPDKFGDRSRAVRHHRRDIQALVPQGADTAAADSALRAYLPPTGVLPPAWAALVAAVRPDRWPATVSAEVQTFVAAQATRPISADDVVFLLATDTASGLLAAVWNAFALTGGPAAVRYLTDPLQPLRDPRGTAVILRVPGMDAGDVDGFRQAMRWLGTFGGGVLLPLAGYDEPVRLHLSGGFKASIPYLIALAEALRSQRDDIKACVLHESAASASGLAKPIDLPLRHVRPDVLTAELGCFPDGGTFSRRGPEELILDGYAYEKVSPPEQGYQLTPFGEGLRALLRASGAASLEP